VCVDAKKYLVKARLLAIVIFKLFIPLLVFSGVIKGGDRGADSRTPQGEDLSGSTNTFSSNEYCKMCIKNALF